MLQSSSSSRSRRSQLQSHHDTTTYFFEANLPEQEGRSLTVIIRLIPVRIILTVDVDEKLMKSQ